MRQFDLLIKKKGGSWDPARAPFIQVSLSLLVLVLSPRVWVRVSEGRVTVKRLDSRLQLARPLTSGLL
jgi:hypothetical protein